MAIVSVIVNVEKERRDEITKIAESLKERGMNVEEELQLLGRITGTTEESNISNLEAVSGVAKIKPGRTFTSQ